MLEQWDKSIHAADSALAKGYHHPAIWTWLAWSLDMSDRDSLALVYYDSTIAGRRPYPSPTEWHNRGRILEDSKRTSAAIASYDSAIAQSPKYGDAWHSKGRLVRRIAGPKSALRLLETAVECDSSNWFYWGDLAQCQDLLGLNRKALDSYREARRQGPEDWGYLGVVDKRIEVLEADSIRRSHESRGGR
jgi:tetratricopeptide (TPR) repeat protein